MLGLIRIYVAMVSERNPDEVSGGVRSAHMYDDFARIQLDAGIRARREAKN
jgi:hypothetical protein